MERALLYAAVPALDGADLSLLWHDGAESRSAPTTAIFHHPTKKAGVCVVRQICTVCVTLNTHQHAGMKTRRVCLVAMLKGGGASCSAYHGLCIVP